MFCTFGTAPEARFSNAVLSVPRMDWNQTAIQMNKKTTIKSLLLIAVASMSAATMSLAQDASDQATSKASTLSERYGQLGARYTGVDFGYTNLDNNVFDDLNGFALRYNQPLAAGLDFSLGYEWAKSDSVGGLRAKAEEATASVTWYTDYNGMRPFVEPGIGWTWTKVGSGKSDSFLYYVGTGVEFQATRRWVIAPYVQFVDATEYDGNTWNFGVKSAYRLTESWGVNVDVSRDDDSNTGLKLGVNYHF